MREKTLNNFKMYLWGWVRAELLKWCLFGESWKLHFLLFLYCLTVSKNRDPVVSKTVCLFTQPRDGWQALLAVPHWLPLTFLRAQWYPGPPFYYLPSCKAKTGAGEREGSKQYPSSGLLDTRPWAHGQGQTVSGWRAGRSVELQLGKVPAYSWGHRDTPSEKSAVPSCMQSQPHSRHYFYEAGISPIHM